MIAVARVHPLVAASLAIFEAFGASGYCGTVKTQLKLGAELGAVVITVSDRCARGEREDRSGPAAVDALGDVGIPCGPARVVPDGIESVAGALAAALGDGARLVVTTGGTGVSSRDLTPEGTATVLHTLLPGISERIRAVSVATIPTAMLSRGIAGIADSVGNNGALVVNLPGSVGAVNDGVSILAPLVRHIIDQLDGGDH